MIFGKYQLLETIGHGGMAEVFKAKSYGVEGFEKLLVIKRILPKFADNSRFVDMFINEAKISVSLNHANVVQVFDLGKVGDSYYIAMEYVHGMDLATIIRTCKKLGRSIPHELVAFIASEVAKGLDYAHRRRNSELEPLNIIHRDISPHNIIISFEGEVKITDFGIARAKDTLEEKGTIRGKYAYMAPEQTRGIDHDRRVDIFSLGVVMYEAIAQANPLRADKLKDILTRIENKDYPSLSDQCQGDISEELSGIVSQAMEPVPEQRFADAGELYEALIAYMYNARARMGVHSLAKFLNEIVGEDEAANPNKNIVLDLVEDTGSAYGSDSSVRDYMSEVTSVQVPTAAGTNAGKTETETTFGNTGPGTRSLPTEVREVTVLAMEFSGGFPPPDILRNFRNIISNSGGTVVDERSDLLVALFGLEIADGRDTQDAIDTGLKLQRASSMHEGTSELQIGVGVYPERLVLTSDGKPREDDTYLNVVSVALNLAKRAVGWVVTSDSGRRLANDRFQFEDVTITSVDNTEQNVCKVTGRRAATEGYGKLLGRREDLRKIGEILATVSRGSGRMVTISGDAGTGKTRVVREVQKRLSSGGHDIGWYEAICVPWRKKTPFAAIASMFRAILGVSEIAAEKELKTKVKRLRELGLIPEEVESIAVLLGAEGDSDVASEERGRQIRAGFIRAISSLCSDRMTIFFFDDLSYVDKESLSVLKYLGKSITYMPALVFAAFRPGLEKEFESESLYNPVVLHPLSERDSKRLARRCIGASHVPEELLIDIALKSSGNPLYIEEYVKALMANDVIRLKKGEALYDEEASLIEFPKTLRGLVGARVKRLPAELQGLIQRASVAGQRFDVRLFSAVTEIEVGTLRTLLLGLIESGVLTRLSANEYAFTSGLVRDVVYEGIVLSDRRDIHVAVARAMEEMFADRLDEFVEKIAIHYQEGGEKLKAVDYLILAGEKVSAAYSNDAAMDYYLTALELLQSTPQQDLKRMLDVYIAIGELSMKTAKWDLGIDKMRLAEELAEELGDKTKLFDVMRVCAELHVRSDRHLEAQQYFKRAIELAEELGDKTAMSSIHAVAGQVYNRIGDMKNAISYYREATSLGSETGDSSYMVSIMSSWSIAEAVSGNLKDARDIIGRAEALLDETTNPISRCKYEAALGTYHYMAGDKEKSLQHQARVVEIGKEYGLKDIVAKNAHTLGDTYLLLGDYRKAYTFLRTSMEIAEELGYDILINLNQIYLAFIDVMKFESEDGLNKLKKSLELANKRDNIWEQLQVHYFLGRIYFERRQYEHAVSHLRQVIRIGRTADNIRYEAETMVLLDQIKQARSETL